MIELTEPLSEEKISQLMKEYEKLKNMPKNNFRLTQIKVLERLIEANNRFCQKNSLKSEVPVEVLKD